MRRLYLLALLLPVPALALGPAVLDGPDLRQLSAGPMVYGGSDGVTCTPAPGVAPRCSDGRTITTTRATSVPCETSPGVWVDVPAGQACVSVRGLEAWGATTNYIANTHLLSGWSASANTTITALGGETGFNVVRAVGGGSAQTAVAYRINVAAGETWTWAVDLRRAAGTSPNVRTLLANGTGCAYSTRVPSDDWTLVTGTCITTASPNAGITLDLASAEEGSWDFRNARSVKGTTPGRPCQGTNASGTTCAADVHTVSTSGWPTASGWIEMAFRPTEAMEGGAEHGLLFDGTRLQMKFTTTGQLRVFVNGTGMTLSTKPTVLAANVIRLSFKSGTTTVRFNGVEIGSMAGTPTTYGGTITLGNAGGTVDLNGSISRLSWSAR